MRCMRPGQRRRHDVAVAHARPPFLVHRDLQRAAPAPSAKSAGTAAGPERPDARIAAQRDDQRSSIRRRRSDIARRRMRLLPRLQHRDQVQVVQPPAHRQSRQRGGDQHRRRPRRHNVRVLTTSGKRYSSVLNAATSAAAQRYPSSRPIGIAISVTARQLAEQDERDLAAREAEHAQARQLAAALRQRHARRVVDHAHRRSPPRTAG